MAKSVTDQIASELERELNIGPLVFCSSMQVSMEVARLFADENSSLSDMAKVISVDPSIAAKIISTANSVKYSNAGALGPVTDVEQAVQRIGQSLTQSIVANICMLRSANALTGLVKEHGHEMWKNSVEVAAWAMALSEEFRIGDPRVCSLLGIMANVGASLILYKINKYPRISNDDEVIYRLLNEWTAIVGRGILDEFNLPCEPQHFYPYAEDANFERPPRNVSEIMALACACATKYNDHDSAVQVGAGDLAKYIHRIERAEINARTYMSEMGI